MPFSQPLIRALIVLLLASSALAPRGAAQSSKSKPQVLPKDVVLKSLDGKEHSLAPLSRRVGTVLAWTNLGCPMCKVYRPRLEALGQEFAKSGLDFLFIDSSEQDSVEELKKHAKDKGLRLPVIRDEDAALARKLGVTRSTEIILADAQGRIVYRGALDDQYGYKKRPEGGVGSYRKPKPERRYLSDAVKALLAGEKQKVKSTDPLGCALNLDWKTVKRVKGAPVYYGEIDAVIQKHCHDCHYSGGSAPFPLVEYADAKGWAEMIGEVITERRMPPWGASADHGTFANTRRMSDREIALVQAWVKAGAPMGEKAKASPPRKFPKGWQIGKPDLVIELPEVDIPAEGRLEYRYESHFTEQDRDRWISSYQIESSSPEVVHHVLVFVKDPLGRRRPKARRPWRQSSNFMELIKGVPQNEIMDYMRRLDKMDNRRVANRAPMAGGLFGYFASALPGDSVTIHPEDRGQLLPKGAELIFQIHYTPDGTARKSTTRMAIKFRDGPPKKNVDVQAVSTVGFKIPPQTSSHVVVADKKLRRDALLLSLHPHMHLRGKSFRYVAVSPDGKEEVLLWVPAFDFDWQHEYRLAKPKLLPKGTVIRVEAEYDNSVDNPYNPDPDETVWFGLQSDEEMLIGYFKVIWGPNQPLRWVPEETPAPK